METRQRLIEAMSTSMRLRGYGSSSMKDVLDEAEATAGSMYHFFPGGKDELAAAAVREVGLVSAETLAATIDASPSVAAGTVAFYEALIDEMDETEFRFGCPIGVPATEAAVVVDDVRVASSEVFESWVRAISSGLESEGWKRDDAQRVARFCVSAYEGASTLARATQDVGYLRDTLSGVEQVLATPL